MPPTGQPNIDFSNLDDAELAQMLRDYGVDVGPINVATRRTYERKLSKLKTGQTSPPSNRYEPVDDDESDNEDDDDIYLKQSTRSNVKGSPRMRARPAAERYTPPRIDSRAPLASARKTTLSYTPPPPRSSPRQKEESRGIPLWVKLLVLVVILTLAYLIYVNMEPQAVSNIPTIQGKMEV